MKTALPVWLGSAIALLVAAEYFIKGAVLHAISVYLQDGTIIISACALVLGAVGMVQRHTRIVSRRSKDWTYSVIALVSICIFPLIAIFTGSRSHAFLFLYNNYYASVSATMFSFLIFYTATAVYRTFTIRNKRAAVLLISGVLLMLGRMPIGDALWQGFPAIGDWIMQVPNDAANRGIIIAAGIGVLASGIRFVVGIERSRV